MKTLSLGLLMLLSLLVIPVMVTRDELELKRFHERLPDANVYRLSKTSAASGHPGELMVECIGGGDATVRPQPEFGRIVVSCGETGQVQP